MKLLSDELYIEIDLSDWEGQQLRYEVYMENYPIEDVKTIYYGQIYALSEPQRIYLNDIIETYSYDNNYGTKGTKAVVDPFGVMSIISINFPDIDQNFSLLSENGDPATVMHYFKNYDTKRPNLINEYDGFESGVLCNALDFKMLPKTVYPRVPQLPYITEEMWLAFMIFQSDEYRSQTSSLRPYKNGLRLGTYALPIAYANNIYCFNTTKIPYSNLTTGDEVRLVKSGGETIKIADVDQCPSKYYLMWIDRTGGWMSWGFDGRCVMSEDVSTQYRVDMRNRNHTYLKSVNTKWLLNSLPLSLNENKAMESILTSPYLYLYDVENDESVEVIVNTNKYESKTLSNTKGLFNLSLEVSTSQSQNILY